MTPTLESLGIDKLTDKEKYELVEAILETIQRNDESSFDLTPEQIRELERRMAEHEADPSSAIPWEVLQAEMIAKYGR